jgi:hypothetical protein
MSFKKKTVRVRLWESRSMPTLVTTPSYCLEQHHNIYGVDQNKTLPLLAQTWFPLARCCIAS